MPLGFHLNLRRKVLLGFLIWFGAIGALAAMSYYNLLRIEGKVEVVEMADDLSNIILEMRRYEKNYFLYGEGYYENLENVDRASAKLVELKKSGHQLILESSVQDLRTALSGYRGIMERVHAAGKRAERQDIDRLRDLGQEMEETSTRIVRFERERIVDINAGLRHTLFVSMGLILALALAVIHFLQTRIIRPLREIEASTRRIAQGDFESLTLERADEEFERIMQAINRMLHELERRQEQLVQNKKLSSIGTLSSGIAHQLNNPLNNISTSCQLLMEEPGAEPEFVRRMLENIDTETIRARDIVRGLLEFTRSKEFLIRRENLAEVVRGALRLVASQVPPDVEIETLVPEGIEVDVDRHQIQELLLNLLINGIDAVQGHGTGLSVTAEVDPYRNTVALRVEDDGCGIGEEVRGRMFDPFYTTKDVGAGTGLGLYIVYGIVRKHGGTICVEGREGLGTRFLIKLPLRAGPREDSP